MKLRLLKHAMLVALLASLGGCTRLIGDFSVISTGAPQYSAMQSAPFDKNIRGNSSRLWLLILPLGPAPTVEAAVNDCLTQGKGDFVERAKIYETGWSLLLISFGKYSCVGDVGNSKGTSPSS